MDWVRAGIQCYGDRRNIRKRHIPVADAGLAPECSNHCGYARTARITAVTMPIEVPAVIKARRMEYCRHMSEFLRGLLQ
ncbi:hypothetical protein GCM10016455_07750 [Aliiroseovarius zhejiangensis]|uniref:Uncharacterized protein n=1 Tax=Aliiroseovarius zhejiangensis TaxID=1632025 RepID=A0ABQ3INT3_9RHOB|nr:hypothetical protein GCM10016455_07750 [Aliiroseovarius zhejiangensis]